MMTDMVLRNRGMEILSQNLVKVEAERFVTLMIREPFDYTKWREGLFEGLSVRDLSNLAMNEYEH